MKLFINDSSPYSRVVRIVAIEKGLAESVTLEWCNPWAEQSTVLEINPANRIPVLVTDDGIPISESILIAQHFDTLTHDKPLLRLDDRETLRVVGLGLGLMEAAFTSVIAGKYEGKAAGDSFLGKRRTEAISKTLQTLDTVMSTRSVVVSLGEVVVGVALSYLKYRMPLNDWENRYAELLKLYERLSQRDSFQQTPFK
ncbi:glutathione S-transferase N-terminal domain-containing protein [Pseudomonas sp. NPDC088368]|uniref:glutathione S-transferase N-terminal domain-containing protein n=1 Tax=Pseudomonas sp. NPDC088368 TaxID=3364453 RepID=UPI00380BED3F